MPLKYEPVEVFMAGMDQFTEEWLDGIEDRLDYGKCYCGHYHTEMRIDKLEIMFGNWRE